MATSTKSKFLPRNITNLLKVAVTPEKPYISLRDFLTVLFASEYIRADGRLDLDFTLYSANLAGLSPESHDVSMADMVIVEGYTVEASLSALFDYAHFAGLVRNQGDDASHDDEISCWSYIEHTPLIKALCWLGVARELLIRICFEFKRVNEIFREQCRSFNRLNNADVRYGNAPTFMHYLTGKQWPQLAAYCKSRNITPQTTRVFLNGQFENRDGLLSIERELTTFISSDPQNTQAFIEVFGLNNAEYQPFLSP